MGSARLIGGIPPPWRNHRDPTGADTPTAAAASSLETPVAISRQNFRSTSRGGAGRPGDRIAGRPVCCVLRSFGHAIEPTSFIEVLRRLLEFAQYTSFAFTSRLLEAGVDASVGSVGDAYDNAMAESQIGLYKTELIRPEGPWRDVEHVEFETLTWVHWFNHERTHESVDVLTPIEVEQAHYAARNRLVPTG